MPSSADVTILYDKCYSKAALFVLRNLFLPHLYRTFPNLNQNFYTVLVYHRRRIKTEEKAKVVASV